MKNEINARIKKLRKQARLTQEDMGKMLGMKRSTYAHIESYGNFKPEHLRILSINFERTVDELIYGDNEFTRQAVEEMKKPTQPTRLQQPDLYPRYNEEIFNGTPEEKRAELTSLVSSLPDEELDTFIHLMKMVNSKKKEPYVYKF